MMEKLSKEKQNNILKFLPWIMLGLIVIVAGIVTIWYFKSNKTHKLGYATYNFCMGSRYDYSENTKLEYNDGTTVIKDSENLSSDGTPLVVNGVQELVLPVSMGYMNPVSESGVKRVNYFSTITKTESGFDILHNDIKTRVKSGFLYDGNGTFIFLEKFTISIAGTEYEVEPLTYVKDFYRDSVEFYDVINDNYKYITINDADVIATSENGYSLNLGTNVMTTGDESRILFTDIAAMGVIK